MKKNLFHVLLFSGIIVSSEIFFQHNLMGQTVTNNGLALTVNSGLTMTISGNYVNQNAGTIANSGTIEVTGNWTNNAVSNVFSTSSGKVKFLGTGMQTIGGSTTTTFYDFNLNNSAGASLTSNVNITDSLTMTTGNMNLSNYILTLGSSSASPGKLYYTGGWMYDGTFRRWFNTSSIADGATQGLFPIGSAADYRPLYISAPSVSPTAGGTISVSHTAAGTLSFVLFIDSNVTINRRYDSYWSVSTGNGLAGGTYNMRAEGTGFIAIPLLSSLRLTQALSAVGAYGTNAGTLLNPQVNRTSISLAQLTNNFYFSYPISALPVEMLSFEGFCREGSVRLNWQTASEANSDYFTVERSVDFSNFIPIEKISAKGNTIEVSDYSAVDALPLKGWNYYRLKQTDFNGTDYYSKVISINTTQINEFIHINNLVTDHIHLSFNVALAGMTYLDVYDLNGKIVQSKNINSPAKNETISMDGSNLSHGIYWLIVKNESQSFQVKLIKI